MAKENKKIKSKTRKIIEWVLTSVVSVVFLFVASCNVSKLLTRNQYGEGNSFGYGSYLVLTNSMEPSYKVGTAIITHNDKPEEICREFDKIRDLNLSMEDERCVNLTFFDAYEVKVSSPIASIYSQTKATGVIMTHQLFHYEIDTSVKEGNGRYKFFVHGINTESENYMPNQYQVFTEKELLGRVKSSSPFMGKLALGLSSAWGLLICLLIPGIYLITTSVIDLFKSFKEEDADASNEGSSESSNSLDNISKDNYEKLKQQMIDEMLKGKGK